MDRIIFHADINHCYAQIEEMKHPELREVPMAVGGHEESRHGIILAKNDLAKKFDIKTGESLRDAKRKCKDLLIIPPHYEDYIYYTEQVKNIYREYTDQVESFGLDEAWCDYTNSVKLFGDPVEMAATIQKRVLDEVGLTISIGISYNKIFAKLGSDLIKPYGLVNITKDNFKETVWPLPVGDLLYVGRATERKLYRKGITTIGDLACYPESHLVKELGKMGSIIRRFANGEDITEVALPYFQEEVKSVGNSITAIHDITNLTEAKIVFYVIAESVASRLKDIGMGGNVVTIYARDKHLNSYMHQRKLMKHTNVTEEIMETVMELIQESWDFSIGLRSIGITVSGLKQESYNDQLSLFEDAEVKQKRREIDCVMDRIRDKYGFNSVKRCCMLLDSALTDFNPKGDHTIHPVGYL